jgi:hypothetical protein
MPNLRPKMMMREASAPRCRRRASDELPRGLLRRRLNVFFARDPPPGYGKPHTDEDSGTIPARNSFDDRETAATPNTMKPMLGE